MSINKPKIIQIINTSTEEYNLVALDEDGNIYTNGCADQWDLFIPNNAERG